MSIKISEVANHYCAICDDIGNFIITTVDQDELWADESLTLSWAQETKGLVLCKDCCKKLHGVISEVL